MEKRLLILSEQRGLVFRCRARLIERPKSASQTAEFVSRKGGRAGGAFPRGPAAAGGAYARRLAETEAARPGASGRHRSAGRADVLQIVRGEGEEILLANLLLQSRGLVEEAKKTQGSSRARSSGVGRRRSVHLGCRCAAALSPTPLLDLLAGMPSRRKWWSISPACISSRSIWKWR